MFKTCTILNLSVFVQLLYMKEMLSHTRYNCSGRWRRGGGKSTFQDSVPVLRLRGCENAFNPEQVRMWRVHRSLGVGTVWRWISASGGWNCLPSLGETQCRRQAWPKVESVSWGGCEGRHKGGTYGDLMGPAGSGLARHLRFSTCYEYRHQVGEAGCWPGALRGRSPRTREGRIGPTAQTAVVSSQQLVV